MGNNGFNVLLLDKRDDLYFLTTEQFCEKRSSITSNVRNFDPELHLDAGVRLKRYIDSIEVGTIVLIGTKGLIRRKYNEYKTFDDDSRGAFSSLGSESIGIIWLHIVLPYCYHTNAILPILATPAPSLFPSTHTLTRIRITQINISAK